MKNNFFDEAAKTWNTPKKLDRSREMYEIILENLASKDTSSLKALEIGAGTGNLATLLSKHFSRIDCIDSSEGMRKEFSKHKEELGIDNIEVYDEGFWETSDNKYDFIYSLSAFHHIVDVDKELKLIYEHSHKDSIFFLIDLCPVPRAFHSEVPDFDGHDGFSKEEIEDYFKINSWKLCKYEIIKHGKKEDISFDIFLAIGEKL